MSNKKIKIPGEHKEGVCLYAVQKIRRCGCGFEAVDRLWSKTEERLNKIVCHMKNSAF